MDIETKLKYLEWQPSYTHTRPYRIAKFGRKRKNDDQNKPYNLVFREGHNTEIIKDIRGMKEDERNSGFTLDANGFVYRRYPAPLFTNPKDFEAPDHIKNIFLPECEAILRNEIEGVDQVFIFDWKVSLKGPGKHSRLFDLLTYLLLLKFGKIRKKKSAKERRKRNQNLLSFARQVHIGK
jgi:hypothetical protein